MRLKWTFRDLRTWLTYLLSYQHWRSSLVYVKFTLHFLDLEKHAPSLKGLLRDFFFFSFFSFCDSIVEFQSKGTLKLP